MFRQLELTKENKRLLIKFAVSLLVTVLLTVMLCTLSAFAEQGTADSGAEQAVSTAEAQQSATGETQHNPGDYLDTDPTYVNKDAGSSVIQELIGVDASQPLEIIILLTLIALAPSMLIMMTCFTRIVIVLGFLRTAMQTQSTPPNMVITGMALFLTFFIMAPVFSEINEVAYQPYVSEELTTEEALDAASVPLKKFMLKQTSQDDLQFFLDLSKTEEPEGGYTDEYLQNDLSLTVIVPSFMISELKRAFQMGFLIFLPFLVIDLVVGSTLMSMGMMMLPPAMISMPFKILVFVLADGWNLLIGSVVASHNFNGSGNVDYALNRSFCGGMYENVYLHIFNNTRRLIASCDEQGLTDYAGMMRVVQAYAVQMLTDVYGPVAYTSCIEDPTNGASFSYDTQQSIYNSIFELLDKALQDFQSPKSTLEERQSFDYWCNGDLDMWIQVANQLKLRAALRIVKADPTLAKQKAEEAAKGAILKQDVLINKSLSNEQTRMFEWGDSGMNANLTTILEGFQDPRLPLIMTNPKR